MTDTATYLAHRSPLRMGIMIAFLVLFGSYLFFSDFGWAVPDGQMSMRAARRANTLQMLLDILKWIGGFAAIAGLCYAPFIFRRSEEIRVDAQGISYPPALKETLPWDRVERIVIRKMSLYRVMAVWIRDADDFPIKPMARKVAAMNKLSADYGDINIETNRSDGNFDELIAAVEKYREVEAVR